ncbi:response regulator transcription factor [Sphingosinicella terrae]|jgi:FixJ family two-component response regulator|uniref:response regulator transcription factor n=1 Tax=Sphingosinicella terrae TaxID=2172047 RepID=UPI000E0CF47F|nr:response regulator [Sphingosinicella terrae]
MAADTLISVVEDDESLRAALVGLLRSFGYEARGFASADDYLSVRDGRCGCVIADVHLPGTSGIALIGRLRDLGYSVPVIVITALLGPAVEREAHDRGAFCVLAKPFESEALIDCVERALAA